MSRVVHFTHHLCVVEHAERPEESDDAMIARVSERPRGRTPTLCCHYLRRGIGVHTTDSRRVTCTRCREPNPYRGGIYTRRAWEAMRRSRLAGELSDSDRRFWEAHVWRSDAELVEMAWMECCRHAGVASPFGATRTSQLLGRAQAKVKVELLEKALPCAPLAMAVECARIMRGHLAELEALDEATREAARPIVEELIMAADLLEATEPMFDRAKAQRDALVAKIRGELVTAQERAA